MEAGLDEVAVKRKRVLDAHALHQHEGHAVGQREAFVGTRAEVVPCRAEQILVYLDQADGGALE